MQCALSRADPPQKRLRCKTPPPRAPQTALVGLPYEGSEADAKKGRSVYLVTLSRPKAGTSASGRTLSAPGSFSREQILEIFLECCAKPIYVDPRSLRAPQPVPILQTGVFRELYKEDDQGHADVHDHLPMLSERPFMYLPVKRALMDRYGLASHWSASHDGYWSAIRHVYYPSPKKQDAVLDKLFILWGRDSEHPPIDECCHEPWTAAAIHGRRLSLDRKAAEKGTQAPRVTEMDLWPVVVRHGFRNTADDYSAKKQLQVWAKIHASLPMRQFLFKNRSKLDQLIADIWEWEEAENDLMLTKQSRLDGLQAAACKPCACQGEWTETVLSSLDANGICATDLFQDIYHALAQGRSVTTPVLVLAGARGGEGKSILLKSLFEVYGIQHVFSKPAKGGFPLVDLPGRKVVFLDEWRFDDSIVSYSDQCLWFDGSILPINRPQNVPGAPGHTSYKGSAPILVTSKLEDIQALADMAAIDPYTGKPRCAEASMLYRRLKVYPYTIRISKPSSQIPFCGHCFASLVLRGGVLPNAPDSTSGGTWL